MIRPSPAQVMWARRLLDHESADGNANYSTTTATGRVYDKLHAQLATLLGDAGVQSLFVRSAKIMQGEFAGIAHGSVLESSMKLRECLHSQSLAASTESTAALFATFFALVTTFIGERLTTQVLRRAWPALEETETLETKK